LKRYKILEEYFIFNNIERPHKPVDYGKAEKELCENNQLVLGNV
jgi:hypothetical protein